MDDNECMNGVQKKDREKNLRTSVIPLKVLDTQEYNLVDTGAKAATLCSAK